MFVLHKILPKRHIIRLPSCLIWPIYGCDHRLQHAVVFGAGGRFAGERRKFRRRNPPARRRVRRRIRRRKHMVSCHNFRPTQPSPACASRRFLRHQAHCPITRRRPCAHWTCPCAATGLLWSDISWSANFETLSSVSGPWRSPRRYTHNITTPINVQALGRPFKLHALTVFGTLHDSLDFREVHPHSLRQASALKPTELQPGLVALPHIFPRKQAGMPGMTK